MVLSTDKQLYSAYDKGDFFYLINLNWLCSSFLFHCDGHVMSCVST